MTEDATLTVGAAAAQISVGVPVELAGYARRGGPALAVHDPLHVRTTVFRCGTAGVALVVLDLLYVPAAVVVLIRRTTAAILAIDPDAVLVAATHTHSGPAGLTLATDLHPALQTAAAEAARGAAAAAEPARLALATRDVAGLSANRRHDGGSTDRSARMLIAKAAADPSRTLAVIVNFACHATVLGPAWNQVSADFPGVACRLIERAVGGTATYLQGFAGDVNPARSGADWAGSGWAGSGWDECERIGGILGSTAFAAVLQAQGLFSGLHVESPTHQTLFDVTSQAGCREIRPRIGVRWGSAPVEVATKRPRITAGADTFSDAQQSETWIADLLAAEPNLFGMFDPGPPERLDVQLLSLSDDLQIIALPGEPFGATAFALRCAASGDLLTAGYANQSVGYLPPPDEWATGGYEIGCCRYEPTVEPSVRRAAEALLGPAAAGAVWS